MAEEIYSDLVADLGEEMSFLVAEELQRGWQAQKALAAVEVAKVAQVNNQIEHCTVEGLGQHVMDIPADAYFAWKKHLGDDCWKDKGFRRWFKKQNPETAVAYTSRNTTIIVP
jgi:hypothetical protein